MLAIRWKWIIEAVPVTIHNTSTFAWMPWLNSVQLPVQLQPHPRQNLSCMLTLSLFSGPWILWTEGLIVFKSFSEAKLTSDLQPNQSNHPRKALSRYEALPQPSAIRLIVSSSGYEPNRSFWRLGTCPFRIAFASWTRKGPLLLPGNWTIRINGGFFGMYPYIPDTAYSFGKYQFFHHSTRKWLNLLPP